MNIKMKKNISIFLVIMLLMINMLPQSVYAAASVKSIPPKATLLVSKTLQLKVDGATSKAKWSSSNKKVARVSSKGVVKGVKPGKAKITAKVGKKKYTCKITVKIGLDQTNVSLNPGQTTELKLCGAKIKKTASSNKSIATVTKKGVVTAVGIGTAKITVTDKNKKKYSCVVNVVAPPSVNPTPVNPAIPVKPEPVYYTVSFNSNGGTAVSAQQVVAGSCVSVPKSPTRDGYTFDYWSLNDSEYDFSKPVHSNITLFAEWIQNPVDNLMDNVIDRGDLQYLSDEGKIDVSYGRNGSVEFIDGTFSDIKVYSANDASVLLNENTDFIDGFSYSDHYITAKQANTGNGYETFYNFSPEIEGVPVIGSQVVLGVGSDGTVSSLTSSYRSDIDIYPYPDINEYEAIETALDSVMSRDDVVTSLTACADAQENISYEDIAEEYRNSLNVDSRLVIYAADHNQDPRLVYEVKICGPYSYDDYYEDEDSDEYADVLGSDPDGLFSEEGSSEAQTENPTQSATAEEDIENTEDVEVLEYEDTIIPDETIEDEGNIPVEESSYEVGDLPAEIEQEEENRTYSGDSEDFIEDYIPADDLTEDDSFSQPDAIEYDEQYSDGFEEDALIASEILIDEEMPDILEDGIALDADSVDNIEPDADSADDTLSAEVTDTEEETEDNFIEEELTAIEDSQSLGGTEEDNLYAPVISTCIYVDASTNSLFLVVDMQEGWTSTSVTASSISNIGLNDTINVQEENGKYRLKDTTRNIEIYKTDYSGILFKTPSLPGKIAVTGGLFSNTVDDEAAYCMVNMSKVYDYYKNVLGRRSFDDNGKTIKVSYDYHNDGFFWDTYFNAYWDPDIQQFAFGNDGRFDRCLDVMGHEFTHSVISYVVGTGYSPGLIYSGESGGLNESYADIIGSLIEGKSSGDRWLIGEDGSSNALRSMQSPKSVDAKCLENYSEYTSQADVHYTSSIFNYAAYKMMTDSRTSSVSSQTWADVFYKSLFSLTEDATFLQGRRAVLYSANNHGFTSQQQQAIKDAYDAVGICEPDNVRIVLTWGSTPDDLDSHLVGPRLDGDGMFHTWYSNKTYFDGNMATYVADLDYDDTTSYGPEMTTIHGLFPGEYLFFVHDYTNRDYPTSNDMAHSGAKVRIFRGKSKSPAAEYNISTGSSGIIWNVCKIIITSTSASISPINTYSGYSEYLEYEADD